MHYKLFRVITLSARAIALKSDKDGKLYQELSNIFYKKVFSSLYLCLVKKRNDIMNKATATILLLVFLASCSPKLTEKEKMEEAIRHDMPFTLDSLYELENDVYGFTTHNALHMSPDYELRSDGSIFYNRTYFTEPARMQDDNCIWRNLTFSKKEHRILAIDRFPGKGDKTQGRIYVLQSDSHKYPTLGHYHWDVTDRRSVQMVGNVLDDYGKKSVQVCFARPNAVAQPQSQNEWWRLVFRADSLWCEGRPAEAWKVYDVAFSVDKYILPSYLSTIAGRTEDPVKREALIRHRMKLECDYYDSITDSLPTDIKETFMQRANTYNYDLPMKKKLERILEQDQYQRMLWWLAAHDHPKDSLRNNALRDYCGQIDLLNQGEVKCLLQEYGYPRKSKVGNMAAQAPWLVIQHADLETQKALLPQLKAACQNGDLPKAMIAALEDRIEIREGRPQKYGTQTGCKLLDKTKVNQWRKAVGLPPMEIK